MLTSHPGRRSAALLTAVTALVLLVACTSGSTAEHRPAATTGASAGSSAVPPGPAPTPSRPNIVFVLTDDLSSDLVQYMPHVRALQQAGTSFSKYFVVDSLCCPSRAAILTGSYPHNTGIFFNSGKDGGYGGFLAKGNARKTFGTSLQRAGYRTGFMGKYLNDYRPHGSVPPGWNEWDVTGSQGYREYDFDLNENGHVHHYGRAPRDYLTTVLSAKATDFIQRAATSGRPFALEVATYAPHASYTPAPADVGTFPSVRATRNAAFNRLPAHAPHWLAGYTPLSPAQIGAIDRDFRKRVEAVQAIDRMIGHLQAVLAARGLLDDTYFLFSSDNGFHMGQYRFLPGKQTAFDTDIRVPLVVAGPGVPAGRTDSTLVSSIDLAPTFEQIAGAHPRYTRDGLSLLPLLHGRPAPTGWPRAVLVEHRTSTRPGDPDRQTNHSGMGPSYEALRSADALYVEYVTGDREYYDLRTDPLELNNIVGSLTAQRLRDLHRMLAGLSTCRGEQCRSRTLAP